MAPSFEPMPAERQEIAEFVSFRDPAGRVVLEGGRVIRLTEPKAVATLDRALNSACVRRLVEQGRVVRTRRVQMEAIGGLSPLVRRLATECPGNAVFEHERIPFPSYPFEWAPEMLWEAGSLTLEIAANLLEEGMGLKDATPYNILFRGAEPVLVDVLSFEQRDPSDPIWLPYAQFVRTFLFPLLANRYLHAPIEQTLLMRREGPEVEDLYRRLSWTQRLRSPFLSLVAIPAWLGSWHGSDDTRIHKPRRSDHPEKARYVLGSLLRRLKKTLKGVQPDPGARSQWRDYMKTHTYGEDHFRQKELFVAGALQEATPAAVLDVGCNTGHFSLLASRMGARVVAVDSDPAVIGELWRNARERKLDLLPLVVNIARPTPATGWRNRECPSFLDRARGGFDAVFMLALLHHLIVTEGAPVAEVIELVAELTRGIALIEYVGPQDRMFRRLTRGREELHEGFSPEVFEAACRKRFDIVRWVESGEYRRLYLLRVRNQGAKRP